MSFFITPGHEAFGYSIIDSVMLLFYRDPMEQAIRKRQLQRHSRFPFLLMEHSLSQRPFQEVISGSSVPSSGPNGEGRAPEFIDYPHPPP